MNGPRGGPRVRVLTWNLWWRFGDWAARGAAIEATLRVERPDVCCLQEVWAEGEDGVVPRLSRALDLPHVAWSPSPASERWQRRIGGASVLIGNAILSRYPLRGIENIALPDAPDDGGGRTVAYALAVTPYGDLPVFTTHLASAPHLSAARAAQVRTLAVAVADRPGDLPPVLTGDFNALPESDEIRLLEGVLTAPVVPGRNLLDAWRFADPGDPGSTWDHRRNPYVRAGPGPSGRVDYVFLGPGLMRRGGAIDAVRLTGDRAVDGVWPSDHFGVVVDLRFGPAGRP